jgi:hypothetical protein
VAKRPTLTVVVICQYFRERFRQYWGAVFLMMNKVTILPSRMRM